MSPAKVPWSRYLYTGIKQAIELLDFYLVYFVIVPVFLLPKVKFKGIIATIIYLVAYWAFYAYGFPEIIELIFKQEQPVYATTGIYYTFLYAFMGFLFRYTIEGVKNIREKEQMEKQTLHSELSLLRSQVNPHFLFNTLNNIHSFINYAPEKASDSVLRLSEIMRYMLFTANKEEVLLDEEINYLNSYLDLQKVRMSNPNALCFEVKGKSNGLKVPPMLFIPFMENAFKHCKKNLNDGAIQFELCIEPGEIVFTARNPFNLSEQKPVSDISGIGLNNVKRRLDLMYPERYKLEISELNNVFDVYLSLELPQIHKN